MKKLEIITNDFEVDDPFDYNAIHDKYLVDLSEELKPAPTALGIGYHEYKGNQYLNNTFSYGEFSAIVAASKSKKTFFKSALIAAYIGGRSSLYFDNMQSCKNGDPFIIDIDTEQGTYYAQRAFRRVADMVGENYDNYLPFGVDEMDSTDIVKFIDGLVNDKRYKGRIGWMSIDGVADLLVNPNDINESVEVAQKLKLWRKQANMHINTVIHRTKTSSHATGHLGSYIQKKAETVILLTDTDEDPKAKNSPIEVVQVYSRGAPFDPFHFKINEETLPVKCEENLPWN